MVMREFDLEKYRQQFGVSDLEADRPAVKEFPSEKMSAEVLYFLSKNGVVKEVNGKNVVDVARLKQGQLPYASSNRDRDSGKKITAWDTLKVLSETKGVEKQDQEASKGKQEERPIMVFPKSLKEMQNGEYAAKANQAMMQPWELGKAFKYWQKEIKLASGETANCSELALVKALADFRARRNEYGDLEIFDPKKQEYVKFSGNAFHRLTRMQFGGARDNIYMNPKKFAREHLKNLLALGILKDEDFGSSGGSRVSNIYGEHERVSLSPEKTYVSFLNSDEESAKYYLDKESLNNLGILIRKGITSAKKLAPDLVGIIEKEDGKQKIIATLSLAVGEEMKKVRNQAAARLRQDRKGGPIHPGDITENTVFKADYSKTHLKKYSITDYLPPRTGESPEEYFKRIEPLNNEEFVFKTVQQFYSDAGVGTHNLPWSEQLILARSLLEGLDRGQLMSFAKSYGLAGIRAFLSLDYDSSLGSKILEIGKNLEPVLAKEVFSKYGEILDAASDVQKYLISQGLVEPGQNSEETRRIKENLMKRAKDLLAGVSDNLQKEGRQLSAINLIQQLEAIRGDILLFSAVYKSFAGKENIKLKEFPGVNVEEKNSAGLTNEEKEDMRRIFSANRLNSYPEKLRQYVVKDFNDTLTGAGHMFRLLKHNGKLIAFLHYDELDNNNLYVGSLNLHPSAKDSPLAVVFLKEAMAKKADQNLKAVVWADNPARLFYTKFLGFRKIGEDPNYHGTGENYWLLERSAKVMELEKAA